MAQRSFQIPELVTRVRRAGLSPNQVLAFGSNHAGFHGAGIAGLAFRGTPENTWRCDSAFLRAMRAQPGSPDRVGLRAVYGVGRGPQQGREGLGYAIETVRRPGARCSVPLSEIREQVMGLVRWAAEHADLEVFCCVSGAGYNGWSTCEVRNGVYSGVDFPENICIPADMAMTPTGLTESECC